MNKKLYLTDEQYQRILLKIKETVDEPSFQCSCDDSTEIGNKYTRSNCGLCNDEFADKDMALFPEDYPERKSMKYRQKHHKCPFDMQIKSKYWDGCFYTCRLFQIKKYRGRPGIKELRQLVDKRIEEVA